MAILTKYISFYNINEENELMVNALSGAIDIIDYGSEKNLELSLKEQNKNHLKDETKKLFKDSQKVEDVNNILSDDINNIEKLQDEEFNKIVKNQMKIRKDWA